MQSGIFFYIASILIAIYILFPRIFSFDINFLNPDTFAYIAISNFYFYSDNLIVRDAFTVGPVIPLYLFFIKLVISKFFVWKGYYDILIVNATSLTCYVIFVICIMRVNSKLKIPQIFSIAYITFVLYFLPISTDTVSLNGELVASTFLILLFLLVRIKNDSIFYILKISFLAILCIYTKLQSILILLFILNYGINSFRTKISIIFIIIIFDLLLFNFNLGVTYNFSNMINYIQMQPHNKFSIEHILLKIDHINFVVVESYKLFVVMPFLSLAIIFSKNYNKWYRAPWFLLFITLLTIYIPGRNFQHYFLFLMPFIVFYSGEAINSLLNGFENQKLSFLPSGALIFLLIFLNLNSFNLSLNKNISYFENYNIINQSFIGKEAFEILPIFENDDGDLLVHGWDYRYYTLYKRGLPSRDLNNVIFGGLTKEDYIEYIKENHPKYIIDSTKYSGLIINQKLSLDYDNYFREFIDLNYRKIYDNRGLVLYIYRPPKASHDIDFKIHSASVGCATCFPEIPKISEIQKDGAHGTYANAGDKDTGKFVISFTPQGDLTRVSYIFGPFSDRGAINVNLIRYCFNGNIIKESLNIYSQDPDMKNFLDITNMCHEKRMDIEFIDEGSKFGQWIGFLGLKGYVY